MSAPALLVIAGIGAVVLIASAASASGTTSAEPSVPYDPNDPLGSWKKTVDAEAQKKAGVPVDEQAQTDAWVDFYKKKGHVLPPPEYPVNWKEVGVIGDIPNMGRLDQGAVVGALFEENDSNKLLSLADDFDDDGYPVAANRLRQKAFRIMGATVGAADMRSGLMNVRVDARGATPA